MSDINVWNEQNLKKFNSYRHFPSEMVLRATLSSNYFKIPFSVAEGKKVLDIGSLFGNNLVPFSDRGMKVYGTEVTKESVAICKQMCSLQGIDAQIKKGFNRSLPFDDSNFDLLLSIATIHYEESEKKIKQALCEFRRVVKPNGTCIIKTVAPEHSMFVNSKKLSNGKFKLKYPNDLRNNQKFYFFDNVDLLVDLASNYFDHVEFARITERYPKNCLDFFLLKCDVGL